MTWASPGTAVTGSLATAAMWNVLRDDLNDLYHYKVIKAATESVTSSTTLQNDDELLLPVAANEHYTGELVIFYDASTAGDMKLAFTFPSGATLVAGRIAPVTSATGIPAAANISSTVTTSGDVGDLLPGAGTGVTVMAIVKFSLLVSSTAGNLQLQWAQNTSDGTATRVLAGSFLTAFRKS